MKALGLPEIDQCVAAIRSLTSVQPRIGLILGSGLGSFAETFETPREIEYAKLPNFPTSSVPGHAGKLVTGTLSGIPVVAMKGRVHAYEGYRQDQVVFPVRVLCRLGIQHLVVTNAAGGIRAGFQVGDLMAIVDHLNLSGSNPLIGHNLDALGPRFPDMSEAYARAALAKLKRIAAEQQILLHEGVYASLSGPSYETPAEIRMLRTLGADAVGMSTVPEVIAAVHMGVQVTGISCITNLAAGLGHTKLSHDEVADAANLAKAKFTELLKNFVQTFA